MSFDWNNYYKLAGELIEIGTEAAFRSSISRVYYSLFNILRIQAGYNSRSTKAELSHMTFIEGFKTKSDTILDSFPDVIEEDLVYIGYQLDHLRKERNKADYDGTITFGRRDAEDAYDKAEQIFDILEGEE